MSELRQTSLEKKSSSAYQINKERARQRSKKLTLAGQDIGALPPIKDPFRRMRAEESFREFCENYFPNLFSMEWSKDHLKVLRKIERVVVYNDTLAVAMPRGSGKTTLAIVAVIWAILTGKHKFVYLIASSDDKAKSLLENIKNQFSGNPLLLEDFPEAVYPIVKLEGESRRCTGQRYLGKLTEIKWGSDEIIMPTIPDSVSSGSIIKVAGLGGNFRGALYMNSKGECRPLHAGVD